MLLQLNQPSTYFFCWQQILSSRVKSPHKIVFYRSYANLCKKFPNYLSLRKMSIFLVCLSFFLHLQKRLRERLTLNYHESFLLKHTSMVTYSGSDHLSKGTSCFIRRSSHRLRSQGFSGSSWRSVCGGPDLTWSPHLVTRSRSPFIIFCTVCIHPWLGWQSRWSHVLILFFWTETDKKSEPFSWMSGEELFIWKGSSLKGSTMLLAS